MSHLDRCACQFLACQITTNCISKCLQNCCQSGGKPYCGNDDHPFIQFTRPIGGLVQMCYTQVATAYTTMPSLAHSHELRRSGGNSYQKETFGVRPSHNVTASHHGGGRNIQNFCSFVSAAVFSSMRIIPSIGPIKRETIVRTCYSSNRPSTDHVRLHDKASACVDVVVLDHVKNKRDTAHKGTGDESFIPRVCSTALYRPSRQWPMPAWI